MSTISITNPIMMYNNSQQITSRAVESFMDKCKAIASLQSAATMPTFSVLLHNLLSEADVKGFSDICSWKSHGRAFQIYDREAFTEQIIPFYFKQTRFSSFQRQINLYGFLRMSKGKDRGAYYHDSFLRGKPELCARIERVNTRSVDARSSTGEPDFYQMRPLEHNEGCTIQRSTQSDIVSVEDDQTHAEQELSMFNNAQELLFQSPTYTAFPQQFNLISPTSSPVFDSTPDLFNYAETTQTSRKRCTPVQSVQVQLDDSLPSKKRRLSIQDDSPLEHVSSIDDLFSLLLDVDLDINSFGI